MGKLLIIAVDALDALQLERFGSHLPNIGRLAQSGFYAPFESVWPPDSETAWASIYTGWNPARHGVFRFVDPLEKTASYIVGERDHTVFRGHTFWDIAGRAGRKVCVLFPHIGYPSWDVNGLMVTRSSVESAISMTPRQMRDLYDLRNLDGVKGLAGRRQDAYLAANRRLVERQLDFCLQVLREQEWDLFFSYWSALDLIQHQFWAYGDPKDPTYPGETPYLHAIRDFHVLHDRVIGELASTVDGETSIMVMSDHGHGMRPVKIFNINRLLRDHGFLALQRRAEHVQVNLLRALKTVSMDLIGRFHLGKLASQVLRRIPWTKKLYLSAANLDLDKTVAYITDMSGIKAYSYGGIRILRQNLDGRSYESVRTGIMKLMVEVHDPEQEEESIVRWIKPREELYAGPYLAEYPDLVFELKPGYGAGWDASGPLFGISRSHSLYPGSHRQSDAVFILAAPGARRISRAPDSMMDIAPTALHLLAVPCPESMDGSSVLHAEDSRSF